MYTCIQDEIDTFVLFVERGTFIEINSLDGMGSYWGWEQSRRDSIELGERAAAKLFNSSYLD